ncbi:hypothetical protein BHE74_00029493 [Ensete ventricosum]|nr:hypothetical protein BHE74_00029493 [Ensete ventricosum]
MNLLHPPRRKRKQEEQQSNEKLQFLTSTAFNTKKEESSLHSTAQKNKEVESNRNTREPNGDEGKDGTSRSKAARRVQPRVPEPGWRPSAIGEKVVSEGLAVRPGLLPHLALDPGLPVEDLHEKVLHRRHRRLGSARSGSKRAGFGALVFPNGWFVSGWGGRDLNFSKPEKEAKLMTKLYRR